MGSLFLSPNYVPQPVTGNDMKIASLAWGFTMGFGILTAWTAVKQTRSIWLRHGTNTYSSPYVWMIWLEIVDCLVFSVICWLHLNGNIPPSFAFYMSILTLWALQVQFLLQIIINRVSILLISRRRSFWLKLVVAAMITAINISVYNIWIPARLQISERYIYINSIWDRIEKCLYLVIDALLNWYFMFVVKNHLLKLGLEKYKPLLRFNLWIVTFSLAMDVLIISMMSLSNTFVYMQFHPLAYLVKLNIEMSMADLIAKVSRPSKEAGQARMASFESRKAITAMPPLIYDPGDERVQTRQRKSDYYSPYECRQDYNATSSDDAWIDPTFNPPRLEFVETGRYKSDQEEDNLEEASLSFDKGPSNPIVVHTVQEFSVTVSSRPDTPNPEYVVTGEMDALEDMSCKSGNERSLSEMLQMDGVSRQGKRSGYGMGSKTSIWVNSQRGSHSETI